MSFTSAPNSIGFGCVDLMLTFLSELFEELTNFKAFFNFNDFTEGLLFKVLLPINDVFSDFLVAAEALKSENEMLNTWTSKCIYYTIAYPGIMALIINLGGALVRTRLDNILFMMLFVTFSCIEATLPFLGNTTILFYFAIIVSTCFLLLGFMDLFFHGPCMKKISANLVNYEGCFEASPQLFIQIISQLGGPEFTFSELSSVDVYGITTSLAMLSIDLARNIINNCNKNHLEKKSFFQKIVTMMDIIPAIIFCSAFRIGTIALAVHHIIAIDQWWLIVPLKLALFSPFLILLFSKCFSSKLASLTIVDCWVGTMKECTAFTIWGKLKQNESRWIQLGFQIYYGILFNLFCIWSMFYPPRSAYS